MSEFGIRFDKRQFLLNDDNKFAIYVVKRQLQTRELDAARHSGGA